MWLLTFNSCFSPQQPTSVNKEVALLKKTFFHYCSEIRKKINTTIQETYWYNLNTEMSIFDWIYSSGKENGNIY